MQCGHGRAHSTIPESTCCKQLMYSVAQAVATLFNTLNRSSVGIRRTADKWLGTSNVTFSFETHERTDSASWEAPTSVTAGGQSVAMPLAHLIQQRL